MGKGKDLIEFNEGQIMIVGKDEDRQPKQLPKTPICKGPQHTADIDSYQQHNLKAPQTVQKNVGNLPNGAPTSWPSATVPARHLQESGIIYRGDKTQRGRFT